ncbi:MAG: hypothetical protein Q9194_002498 [Teloschistes cf. exilis]
MSLKPKHIHFLLSILLLKSTSISAASSKNPHTSIRIKYGGLRGVNSRLPNHSPLTSQGKVHTRQRMRFSTQANFSKLDHIQPLQLNPPISLEDLEYKLRTIGSAIEEVREQLTSIWEIAIPQMCEPLQSSRGDATFEYAFKDDGIEFSEVDKRDWGECIKTWNQGIEVGLHKVDVLDQLCWDVQDALCLVTGIKRWNWRKGRVLLRF